MSQVLDYSLLLVADVEAKQAEDTTARAGRVGRAAHVQGYAGADRCLIEEKKNLEFGDMRTGVRSVSQ